MSKEMCDQCDDKKYITVEKPCPSCCAPSPHGRDVEGLVRWEELRRAAAELWDEDPQTWPEHGNAPLAIAAGIALANGEVDRLRQWVYDLQSGMYVNCVYCGHRYGPKETTPVSMADALKAHIEECPEHPMSALKAELAALRSRPVEPEPVAWGAMDESGMVVLAEVNVHVARERCEDFNRSFRPAKMVPLYASPVAPREEKP